MSAKHKSLGKNYRAKKNVSIDDLNFFPTYHSLTRVLLNKCLIFKPNMVFWEPAAGAGDITKILQEYYPMHKVFSTDINPQNKKIEKLNYLDDIAVNNYLDNKPKIDVIITNPPFKKFLEFFKMSAKISKKYILFLCPLDYLHGAERFDIIYKNGYNEFNLDTCFVFERRPLFDIKYRPDGKMPTGATSFCWLLFSKKPPSRPVIEWLEINDYMGQPTMTDELYFFD